MVRNCFLYRAVQRNEPEHDCIGTGKRGERGLGTFKYAGYFVHARSGLGLTPARAYNADLGRWLSRDPANSTNFYGYVENDPIDTSDPTGLFSLGTGSAFSRTLVRTMQNMCKCCASDQVAPCKNEAARIGAALQSLWDGPTGPWSNYPETVRGFYCYVWAVGFENALASVSPTIWKTMVVEYAGPQRQTPAGLYEPRHYTAKLFINSSDKCSVQMDDGALGHGLSHTGVFPPKGSPYTPRGGLDFGRLDHALVLKDHLWGGKLK